MPLTPVLGEFVVTFLVVVEVLAFVVEVDVLDDRLRGMAKDTAGSRFGTGGMATKLAAADIATAAGADMIIAGAEDFRIIHRLIGGAEEGTLFHAHPHESRLINDLLGKREDPP